MVDKIHNEKLVSCDHVLVVTVIIRDNIMVDKIHHENLFSCDHLLAITVWL